MQYVAVPDDKKDGTYMSIIWNELVRMKSVCFCTLKTCEADDGDVQW